MNELPNPLTPADCDLRDFAFMPLDVVRLRDSELSIQVTGEEFRAAVLLWCASWHQVPAASLPDDDKTLAQLAGFGRVVSEWRKVRDGALRGWVACVDGRLYHPVVAEKARDAWLAKLKQRFKTECARIKKHCQRHHVSYSEPDFDEWMEAGCPQGQPLSVPETRPISPEDKAKLSQGQGGSVPREIDSKGQGEGQGQGELTDKTSGSVIAGGNSPRGGGDDFTPKNEGEWQRYFRERYGVELDATSVHDRKKAWPLFSAWCKRGITASQMDAAVAKAQDEATEVIAFLPAYVDRVLASLSRPAPQARLNPDEHRRAISDANAAAFLAGESADPNVIDMEH